MWAHKREATGWSSNSMLCLIIKVKIQGFGKFVNSPVQLIVGYE